MKTNKSLKKRIKVTKTGKLLVRKPGKLHFNAKHSRTEQLAGKRMVELKLTNKQRGRFLPNI